MKENILRTVGLLLVIIFGLTIFEFIKLTKFEEKTVYIFNALFILLIFFQYKKQK